MTGKEIWHESAEHAMVLQGLSENLAASLGRDTADQIWDGAGKEFSKILASQPELKRHNGAMVLPAVALYRVLNACGKSSEWVRR